MSFEAQYPGRCYECDSPIIAGDQVEYVDGSVQHSDHGEAELRERPDNQTCTECWLIKPCECDDTEPEPMEHTDRQAQQLEQDTDSAAINAAMEGLT